MKFEGKIKFNFLGDRKSFTIKLGRFLKRFFPKRISVFMWDGYPSKIYIKPKYFNKNMGKGRN